MTIEDVKVGDIINYDNFILEFKGIGLKFNTLCLHSISNNVIRDYFNFNLTRLRGATSEEIIWYEGAVEDYQQKCPIRTKEQALALHRLKTSKDVYLTSPPKKGDYIVYNNSVLCYPGSGQHAKHVRLNAKALDDCSWGLEGRSFFTATRYATEEEVNLLKASIAAGRYVEPVKVPDDLHLAGKTAVIHDDGYICSTYKTMFKLFNFKNPSISHDVCGRLIDSCTIIGSVIEKEGSRHIVAIRLPDGREAIIDKRGLSIADYQTQASINKMNINNLKPNQDEQESRTNGSSYKAVEPLPRITTRERPRGSSSRGRISKASVELRYLSNQVSRSE